MSPELTEVVRQLEAADKLTKSMTTEVEKQVERWHEAQQLFAEGFISAETLERLKDDLLPEIEVGVRRVAAATDEARKRQQDFASAVAATVESRGLEALFSGRIRDSIRGFAQDVAELVIRLTVLKPIAEKIAEVLGNIGKDKGGGDAKGLLSGVLGGIFGFADGGRPPVGRASWVGEEGPELFVPDTAGRILSNAQSRALAANGGGVTLQLNQHIEAGIPPQWDAQFVIAGQAAATAAYDLVMSRLGGRR